MSQIPSRSAEQKVNWMEFGDISARCELWLYHSPKEIHLNKSRDSHNSLTKLNISYHTTLQMRHTSPLFIPSIPHHPYNHHVPVPTYLTWKPQFQNSSIHSHPFRTSTFALWEFNSYATLHANQIISEIDAATFQVCLKAIQTPTRPSHS